MNDNNTPFHAVESDKESDRITLKVADAVSTAGLASAAAIAAVNPSEACDEESWDDTDTSAYSDDDELTRGDDITSNEESEDTSDSDSGNTSDATPSSLSCTEGMNGDDTDDESDDENEDFEEGMISQRMNFVSAEHLFLDRACDVFLRPKEENPQSSLDSAKKVTDSVWERAKDFLREARQKQDGTTRTSILESKVRPTGKRVYPRLADTVVNVLSPVSSTLVEFASVEKCKPTLISPDIFGDGQVSTFADDIMPHTIALTFYFELNFQWMAKALVWSSPEPDLSNETQDCHWKLITDPFTCVSGLVPPSGSLLQKAIDISEAVAGDSEARLVTLSTPPFRIIHANRAFLVLANLPVADSLIGQPVESIVRVARAECINSTTYDEATCCGSPVGGSLRGLVTLASSSVATRCYIRALPILDRSKRMRLLQESARYSCMSHVLIQVLPCQMRAMG